MFSNLHKGLGELLAQRVAEGGVLYVGQARAPLAAPPAPTTRRFMAENVRQCLLRSDGGSDGRASSNSQPIVSRDSDSEGLHELCLPPFRSACGRHGRHAA